MPRKFDQDAKDRVVRLVEDRILAENERVKLFVCGAGFIGICRSGRGRPRPFG